MNELDYLRDNRLRLWFIARALPQGIELVARHRETAFKQLMHGVCLRLAPQLKPGGYFILVVGDATRGHGAPGRTAALTRNLFGAHGTLKRFTLAKTYQDTVPDIRRSRRECSGTKEETILIYQKR
jgi:hypothetical protein